jgi:hypothetical protein
MPREIFLIAKEANAAIQAVIEESKNQRRGEIFDCQIRHSVTRKQFKSNSKRPVV